jgi:acetyl-CoA carboxylase biotin carboxylase subunit
MFKKILIANRGEIAIRVIRACHEMNIEAVAVFSDADRHSLHVRTSDEAYNIGPAPARESYLDIDKIIEVAKRSKADAIHPGYGFLAENPEFARRCENEGIVFIGPSPDAMLKLGNKIEARKLMKSAGVPIVPGTEEPVRDLSEAKKVARRIGYPVMLKASAGGGGKGMRRVNSEEELESALSMARSEALSSFGDDSIYIEKLLVKPRHVEVQLLGDKSGNVVHLFERECSIQRKHQKLIEETPAPAIDDKTRKEICEVAVKGAKAAKYYCAGTMEFLVDAEKNFYFMEVNTRLQVEHPITERVTGIDVVKAMIEVSAGNKLKFRQEEIEQKGHAIECRICAEDPENNFIPSPGTIEQLRIPGGFGIRDDSGIYEGWEVPLYYDSLLSKLIVWAQSREEAIMRMRRALKEYKIKGIKTNIPFHQWVMHHERFIRGEFDTHFIDEEFTPDALKKTYAHEKIAIISAVISAFRKDKEAKSGVFVQNNDKQSRSNWKTAGRMEELARNEIRSYIKR